MELNGEMELGNLPNLSARLREIEDEHIRNDDDGTMFDAREDLVDAVRDHNKSWYRFGAALAEYKAFYIETRGWMKAAQIIGQAIHRDERTVRRILEGYEHASQLPVEVIEEMETRGIDPAAKKNAPIIKSLSTMDPSLVESTPRASVATAMTAAAAEKAAKKTKATKPHKPVHACETSVFVLPTNEENQRRDIRLAIRAALSTLPNEMKLAGLIAAIEEEMFEVWDHPQPVHITLTPRRSTLAIQERHEQEQAA